MGGGNKVGVVKDGGKVKLGSLVRIVLLLLSLITVVLAGKEEQKTEGKESDAKVT